MVQPTDLHRVFLQSLLSRRAMTDDTAMVMLKRSLGSIRRKSPYSSSITSARAQLTTGSVDPDFEVTYERGAAGLNKFLEDASGLLEPFGMRIKRGMADDGVGWVVLANDEAGDIGRMATDLTPLEISYYRALIEAIMLSHPANSVSNAQALRLTGELKGNMSKRDAEKLLGALTSRGWLAKSK